MVIVKEPKCGVQNLILQNCGWSTFCITCLCRTFQKLPILNEPDALLYLRDNRTIGLIFLFGKLSNTVKFENTRDACSIFDTSEGKQFQVLCKTACRIV